MPSSADILLNPSSTPVIAIVPIGPASGAVLAKLRKRRAIQVIQSSKVEDAVALLRQAGAGLVLLHADQVSELSFALALLRLLAAPVARGAVRVVLTTSLPRDEGALADLRFAGISAILAENPGAEALLPELARQLDALPSEE